jgi:CTP:molybdopterin cytidylyltransferase MocA
MNSSNLVPIILAAGASRRMGRPKALLDFDGTCALELLLEAMAGYRPPVVVLGPDHGEIRRRVSSGGVRWVYNLDVESGQTHSLKAALLVLPPSAPGFFFMPVDFPLVLAADVARLVDSWQADAGGKSIFIPSHRMKRGHPVLCRWPIAEEILALGPGASARDVVNCDPGRVEHVLFPEPNVLMDMDTPDDYALCLDEYRTRIARRS